MSSSTKPVIFVKKSDSKKAGLWHNIAAGRFIKQHGDVEELPDGDLHAVKRDTGPNLYPKADPEETEEALSGLEEEIKQLKNKNIHSFDSGNLLPEKDDSSDE